MRQISKISVSPEYPRIYHLDKNISKMTHDDISLDSDVVLPLSGFEEEKVDGANIGISWLNDGPILRNRQFILHKGYSKIRTPAKEQFKSAWNFVHQHEDDIKEISKLLESEVTIYGEWLLAKHSLFYDKLPSVFIAYDIYCLGDRNFMSPPIVKELLSNTEIKFIGGQDVVYNNIDDIISHSEGNSIYRNGRKEGIVIKQYEGRFLTNTYKVVNKYFELRKDFNTTELVKNKIAR